MFLRNMLLTNHASFFAKHSFSRLPVFQPSHFPSMRKPSVRLFATDADMLHKFQKSQVSRISLLEPRAKELITAIREKNYGEAEFLVKNGVQVDGHNHFENTALTDAAKRGDTKGVEFLLKKLQANPHASCDCPHHKTALHYAAENGHVETVKKLLEYGANPNVLDSRRYTAIDLAKTPEVENLLKVHGGDCGKQIAQDESQLRKFLPK